MQTDSIIGLWTFDSNRAIGPNRTLCGSVCLSHVRFDHPRWPSLITCLDPRPASGWIFCVKGMIGGFLFLKTLSKPNVGMDFDDVHHIKWVIGTHFSSSLCWQALPGELR